VSSDLQNQEPPSRISPRSRSACFPVVFFAASRLTSLLPLLFPSLLLLLPPHLTSKPPNLPPLRNPLLPLPMRPGKLFITFLAQRARLTWSSRRGRVGTVRLTDHRLLFLPLPSPSQSLPPLLLPPLLRRPRLPNQPWFKLSRRLRSQRSSRPSSSRRPPLSPTSPLPLLPRQSRSLSSRTPPPLLYRSILLHRSSLLLLHLPLRFRD